LILIAGGGRGDPARSIPPVLHNLTIGAVEADRVMSRMWGMHNLTASLAGA
jgi:hypothetical protein